MPFPRGKKDTFKKKRGKDGRVLDNPLERIFLQKLGEGKSNVCFGGVRSRKKQASPRVRAARLQGWIEKGTNQEGEPLGEASERGERFRS